MLSYFVTKEKENKMETVAMAFVLVITCVLIVLVGGLMFSYPVMLLWNYCLIAAIPGIKAIGWMQAWGIMILCGLLFKSSSSTSSN